MADPISINYSVSSRKYDFFDTLGGIKGRFSLSMSSEYVSDKVLYFEVFCPKMNINDL